MATRLPKNYSPSDKEPFMNAKQKEFFRRKLNDWRDEIISETKETLNNLQYESSNFADLADRASSETDRSLELRSRDRQRKLIAKIDEALSRIDDGSYGYCEETGEEISLKRLIARPIATLSIEAQELIASILIEFAPDNFNGIEECLANPNDPKIIGSMLVSELSQIIKKDYDWVFELNLKKESSNTYFWYVSQEKLEPRLGNRYKEDGSELEMPFNIPLYLSLIHI